MQFKGGKWIAWPYVVYQKNTEFTQAQVSFLSNTSTGFMHGLKGTLQGDLYGWTFHSLIKIEISALLWDSGIGVTGWV